VLTGQGFTVHVLLEIAAVRELCKNASFSTEELALSEKQIPRFVVNVGS
jgi:hypothetical protein